MKERHIDEYLTERRRFLKRKRKATVRVWLSMATLACELYILDITIENARFWGYTRSYWHLLLPLLPIFGLLLGMRLFRDTK